MFSQPYQLKSSMQIDQADKFMYVIHMRSIAKKLLATIALMHAFVGMPASAEIVDKGRHTLDTVRGLEWLDLSETKNYCFNEVLQELKPGGVFEGYRVATRSELYSVISQLESYAVKNYRSTDDPYLVARDWVTLNGGPLFTVFDSAANRYWYRIDAYLADQVVVWDGTIGNSVFVMGYSPTYLYRPTSYINLMSSAKTEQCGNGTGTYLVRSVNNNPVFDTLDDIQINEGQGIQVPIGVTDPDGDFVTITIDNLPPGASFDGAVFRWIPSYGQAGNYELNLTAIDDKTPPGVATALLRINVGYVNRAPVFLDLSPLYGAPYQTTTMAISVSDPDGHPFSLTASQLPSGASFSNGVFTWKPSPLQVGTFDVELEAVDVLGARSVGSLTIYVGDVRDDCALSEFIVSEIESISMDKNLTNSYSANIKKMCIFIEEGRLNAAREQVDAFEKKVVNDYGAGRIEESVYSYLLSLGGLFTR